MLSRKAPLITRLIVLNKCVSSYSCQIKSAQCKKYQPNILWNVTLFCQLDPECQTDKLKLRSYIYSLYVSSFLLIVSEAEAPSLLTEGLIPKTEIKADMLHVSSHCQKMKSSCISSKPINNIRFTKCYNSMVPF